MTYESESALDSAEEAEVLSERAAALAQVRLEQLINAANSAQERFQTELTKHSITTDGMTRFDLDQEAVSKVTRTLDGLSDYVAELKRDLSKIEEVTAQRHADVNLQASVVQAYPEDAPAQLLIYASIATIGGGGVTYGLSGFPAPGWHLLPALVVWIFGIALFLVGYRRLDRWQTRKFALFRTRLRVKEPN